MPHLTDSVPKYRCHKSTGQAVVTLNGRDFYLGSWKSKASLTEYDRLFNQRTASGRRGSCDLGNTLTVVEVLASYWIFAKQHYRKNGQPTCELSNIRSAVRPL